MESSSRRTGVSIVLKVSILAGSIAAVASFIVGSLIVNGSVDIVYDNALNRLKYETNIKALGLVSDIKNLSGDTQYLVGTPPILGIPRAKNNNGIDPLGNSSVTVWSSRLATIFSELIRAKPNYLQIRYIGIAGGGKELVRVDRKGSVIRVMDGDLLQKKGSTDYYKNAIKLNPGEVYLSEISLNREFGKISEPYTPVIRAVAPVFFNKEIFGVLVINMEFGEIFADMVKNTPRELIPYVTNEEGYFLAHPDSSMTYGFDLGNDNRIQMTYQDFDLQHDSDIRDVEFTVETNGYVVHVVKANYDSARNGRYFAVMLATSYENLTSKSIELRYQSFIIMGLLVVLSLIVAAVLASRLMRPLQLITIASDDLARGRVVMDLPVDASGEIGELARSFDDMRSQLKDKEHELLISQGHVYHANKMASLGEMAAGMAHEINSPIQTISFIAQRVQRQLKKDMSSKDINKCMGKITENVEKISEIIDSLRKVSRDSIDDEFFDVCVSDLIVDVVNMTSERFKVNDVKFEVSYHDVSKNMFVQCQHLQISQVLVNLVNNAYDAIREIEEKWIKIDIRKVADKVQISVTDSGAGIENAIAEKMFEPMYTTKGIGEGTGLGLSISRDITANHNGLLYLDEDSSHTRFVLELPLVQSVKLSS